MLRAQLFGVLFAVLLPLAAVAQESIAPQPTLTKPAAEQSSDKATYFLIDSSGSMRGKDAEGKVSELLKPISASDPQALVSRTYFRAENGAACWSPVPIGNLIPAAKSMPSPPVSQEGFTPLGEALKAAILHAVARGRRADIYIISDEEQTTECGVDICAVAKAYLPLPGIKVQSLAVDDQSATHHDRLGCIEGAQAIARVPVSQNTSRTPTTFPTDGFSHFLEKWSWLFGFSLVALSAAWLGQRDSNKALALEIDAAEARSYRDLIDRGDTAAKTKLDKIIEKNTPTKKETKNPALRKLTEQAFVQWLAKQPAIHWLRPEFWLFWIGGLGLLLLTFTPDTQHWGSYRFRTAREAAWDVLNSNFSTAFAVTWIAVLFFWASQSQRLREAKHNLNIATEEGERVARLRATETQQRAFAAYTEVYDAVANQLFPPPWPRNHVADADANSDAMSFRRIEAAAISLALGKKLLETEAPDAMNKERLRLKAFMPPQNPWFVTWDFVSFVARLRNAGLLPNDTTREDWDVIAAGDQNRIVEALRNLDTKLREQ